MLAMTNIVHVMGLLVLGVFAGAGLLLLALCWIAAKCGADAADCRGLAVLSSPFLALVLALGLWLLTRS